MLPDTSLSALIQHLKQKLSISQLRYIGNLNQFAKKYC